MTIKLWDVPDAHEVQQLTGHRGEVRCVTFAPDGRTLASASNDRSIMVWDRETGEMRRQITGHAGDVRSVVFLPNGKQLVSGSVDKTIRFWDPQSGSEQKRVETHRAAIQGLACSRDGKTLASASDDKTIELLSAETGELQRTLTGHTDGVAQAAFSPDGRRLASASWDKTIRIWDVATGKLLLTINKQQAAVRSVSFSPNGNRLASGGDDHTIRLWDAEKCVELATLRGHRGPVTSVAFSADGRILASASADRTVMMWELEEAGRPGGKPPSGPREPNAGPAKAPDKPAAAKPSRAKEESAKQRAKAPVEPTPSPLFPTPHKAVPKGPEEPPAIGPTTSAKAPGAKPQGPPAATTSKPTGPVPPPAIAPFDAKTAKEHQAAWAKFLNVPVEMVNSIGMRFVLIPPGEFDMGSTEAEVARLLEEAKARNQPKWYMERLPFEAPKHRVRIKKPFYLGLCEVTQAQYEGVVGNNPSNFKDDATCPVEMVSWDEASAFCRKLTELPRERAVRAEYRLPTEAEWEYACRGGTTTAWYWGDNEAASKDHAWYDANGGGKTHPVAQKTPNSWGLYDMHGNAWEWCQDWWGDGYYATSPIDDPTGPTTGAVRADRGGAYQDPPPVCRATYRGYDPGHRDCIGFRLVRIVSYLENETTSPHKSDAEGSQSKHRPTPNPSAPAATSPAAEPVAAAGKPTGPTPPFAVTGVARFGVARLTCLAVSEFADGVRPGPTCRAVRFRNGSRGTRIRLAMRSGTKSSYRFAPSKKECPFSLTCDGPPCRRPRILVAAQLAVAFCGLLFRTQASNSSRSINPLNSSTPRTFTTSRSSIGSSGSCNAMHNSALLTSGCEKAR